MDEDIVPASPPAVDTGNGDSNAAAGPSTLLPPPKTSWGEKPLPRATYRSIEYPGPVAYPDLIHTVIRPLDIEECFNANIADARQLEMRYRGAGPEAERSAVPVRGTRVASQKMLVKLTKRRKKALPGQTQPPGGEGVFTVDVIGSIPQTVRFRCKSARMFKADTAAMADYQFTPAKDTGIAELTQALDELDCKAWLWSNTDAQTTPFCRTSSRSSTRTLSRRQRQTRMGRHRGSPSAPCSSCSPRRSQATVTCRQISRG